MPSRCLVCNNGSSLLPPQLSSIESYFERTPIPLDYAKIGMSLSPSTREAGFSNLDITHQIIRDSNCSNFILRKHHAAEPEASGALSPVAPSSSEQKRILLAIITWYFSSAALWCVPVSPARVTGARSTWGHFRSHRRRAGCKIWRHL